MPSQSARQFGMAMHLPRVLELNEKGWTQAQIAKDLSVSQSTIARLLRDHRRSRPTQPYVRPPRWPVCGRPFDVLRFIDYAMDPDRPFIVNLNGGVGEIRRALREAEAGLRAAEERYEYQRQRVDAQLRLVKAMEDLEMLNAD